MKGIIKDVLCVLSFLLVFTFLCAVFYVIGHFVIKCW